MLSFSGCDTSAYRIRALSLADATRPGEDLLLKGLLPQDSERRRWMECSIAVCAEASALAGITGHGSIAMILCSGCLWALWWHYRKETSTGGDCDLSQHDRRSLTSMLLVYAILIAGWAWYLWPAKGNAMGAGKISHARTRRPLTQHETSWDGIILWPNPPRKAKIDPPPMPHSSSMSVGRITKPLVIPFSGAYWFFKSPATAPSAKAHVAHGNPTAVIIRSSDWHRLEMEANQGLSVPIDLRCCRAIELAIRNGDSRPGRINIAMRLIDSSAARSENLGSRPVSSSMASELLMDRPPIDEVLQYRIAANPHIRQFDQIQIVFEPSPGRSLGGEQIAIREFRFLPKY